MSKPSEKDVEAVARWLYAASVRTAKKRGYGGIYPPWNRKGMTHQQMHRDVARQLLAKPPVALRRVIARAT